MVLICSSDLLSLDCPCRFTDVVDRRCDMYRLWAFLCRSYTNGQNRSRQSSCGSIYSRSSRAWLAPKHLLDRPITSIIWPSSDRNHKYGSNIYGESSILITNAGILHGIGYGLTDLPNDRDGAQIRFYCDNDARFSRRAQRFPSSSDQRNVFIDDENGMVMNSLQPNCKSLENNGPSFNQYGAFTHFWRLSIAFQPEQHPERTTISLCNLALKSPFKTLPTNLRVRDILRSTPENGLAIVESIGTVLSAIILHEVGFTPNITVSVLSLTFFI